MATALKYEGKFENGDTIRAMDFEPMEGRPDCYIEGCITGTTMLHGAKMYTIFITKDSWEGEGRKGDTGYIPMEMSHDFDGRIERLK